MTNALTTPRTYTVTFTGEVPPAVIPGVVLDGLSRQRIEVAVERHLSELGMPVAALDVAAVPGRTPTVAAITEQGVITGTLTTSSNGPGGRG